MKILKFKSLIIILLLAIQAVSAQDRVRFVYFAPTATMRTIFGSANIRQWARVVESGVPVTRRDTISVMAGYRWVHITPANVTLFRNNAPVNLKKLYDSLNAPASKVRRKMDEIMGLGGNRRVVIHLVDDRTSIPMSENYVGQQIETADNKKYVWPAARGYLNTTLESSGTGEVYIGDHFMNAFGNQFEGVMLHEISHTQRARDARGANTWGEVGTGVSYGAIPGHTFNELQGSEESALDEAMGNFWKMTHTLQDSTWVLNLMTDSTARLRIEKYSPLFNVHEAWNAPHTTQCAGPTTPHPTSPASLRTAVCGAAISRFFVPDTAQYETRLYKWKDMPGRYIMNSEQMSQAYLYLYWRYAFARPDSSMNKIKNLARTLYSTRDSRDWHVGFLANHLAFQMERYANTAHGQAEQTANRLTSSLFSYALLDLLRHFSNSDLDFEADMRTYSYGSGIPFAMEAYKRHRANLRTAANPFINGPNINIRGAVVAMRAYLQTAPTILKQ
ncbi:hypothetical protein GVN16_03875 [Emticicia sp. CRIBPO]|uniref:hypothetical protein n=1 Tax=Emticicia sp. CRIBPO TaxID=2683258 RepID=UPI001411F8DF|nr:hypothetical protein [Emticicia sp. CRIBPO]NBA84881.1 hypothetical protein [Emticicia sp. CRIBPO]